jgi:hypothetical protein
MDHPHNGLLSIFPILSMKAGRGLRRDRREASGPDVVALFEFLRVLGGLSSRRLRLKSVAFLTKNNSL